MIDLCSKYRPTTLKDVYGQPHVSGFFQSVAKRPDDSPRYYLLQGPWGSGKCVAGSTLVVTPTGVRSIRSLFPDTLPDKEGVLESSAPYCVTDGFEELAESTTLYYSGVVPAVRVRSVSAPDLVCTPHHPLYAFDSVTGRFDWVQARELVPQRHTLMTSACPVSKSIGIDPDWYAYGVVFGAKSWVAASGSFKRTSPDSLCLSHWCLERIKGSEASRGISLDDFKSLGLFPQGCFPAFWTGSFPSSRVGVSFDNESLYFLLDRTLEEQVSFALGYLANNIKISSPSVFLTRVPTWHYTILQTILSAAGLVLRPYHTQSKSSSILVCGLHSVLTLSSHFKECLGLDRLECDIPSVVESGLRSTVVRGLVQSLRRRVSKAEFRPFVQYKHGGVQSLFRYLDDHDVLGDVSQCFIPSEVLGVESAGMVECFDLSLPTIRHSFTANTIVSHNTSVARAFAHDLLGPDYASQPNYMEIDSSEKAVTENFDYFKDMMFQELPGWKVVVLDEIHLLPSATSQQLLKILEDYVGRLFILSATTNPELLFPPLLSRLHKFSINLFSTEQVQEYLRGISDSEGFQVSDQTLSLIALNSQGHMRDAVKGLELVMVAGEERYLSSFSPVWREVESYFLASDVDPDRLVSALSPYPASQLKSYFSYFMRHRILNPKAQGYGETFPVQFLPKLYSTWLSMSAKVSSQDEFFGMLLAMLPVVSGLRGRR